MLKIIFLAISIYVLFRILNKQTTRSTEGKNDLSKKILSWKHNEAESIKKEALYSSRHESTPSSEKAAEGIVSKYEKIVRETMKNEESE